MKYLLFIVLIATSSAVALAEETSLMTSPTAAFASPDSVAKNIQTKCDLPAYQADAVRRQLAELNIASVRAEQDEIPAGGKYLQLRIQAAYSAGNAGIGHHKQVTTLATLFENGKEIGKVVYERSSMGGVLGGFMGSCKVLQRCADAAAGDIAKWLRRQLTTSGTGTPDSAHDGDDVNSTVKPSL